MFSCNLFQVPFFFVGVGVFNATTIPGVRSDIRFRTTRGGGDFANPTLHLMDEFRQVHVQSHHRLVFCCCCVLNGHYSVCKVILSCHRQDSSRHKFLWDCLIQSAGLMGTFRADRVCGVLHNVVEQAHQTAILLIFYFQLATQL